MQREYKRRYDAVAKLIHWKLCEKRNFERKEKWYEYCPEGVVQNDDAKIFGDIIIQCNNVYKAKETQLNFVGQKDEIMRHHRCSFTR